MTSDSNNAEVVPGANARLEELGRGCYAFSADGCSNTGVIIGERGVLIVDAQATPDLAAIVLQKIRDITDKPVKQVLLTHFHADTTLGASAFEAGEVVASDLTRRMMDTRGAEEILVSLDRQPALFSTLPAGITVSLPSMTVASSMSIDLGGLDVRVMHLGRGHTMGDLVVWVPKTGVLYAGDLVQTNAAPYCGDAHLADWPRALDRIMAFRPTSLMPGRGRSAKDVAAVAQAIENTRDFVTTLRDAASACVEQSLGIKDTFAAVKDTLEPQFGSRADFELSLPFNVARAYDEALGLDQPQIWARERCADRQDARGGVVETSVSVAEIGPQPVEEVVESETDVSELVSDNDFAASLLDGPGAEEPGDEEILDLSADDIVETADEDQDFENTLTDQGEFEEPKVLLEGVR